MLFNFNELRLQNNSLQLSIVDRLKTNESDTRPLESNPENTASWLRGVLRSTNCGKEASRWCGSSPPPGGSRIVPKGAARGVGMQVTLQRSSPPPAPPPPSPVFFSLSLFCSSPTDFPLLSLSPRLISCFQIPPNTVELTLAVATKRFFFASFSLLSLSCFPNQAKMSAGLGR